MTTREHSRDWQKATPSQESRARGAEAFPGPAESAESLEFAIPSIPLLHGFPVHKRLAAHPGDIFRFNKIMYEFRPIMRHDVHVGTG